MKSLVRGVVVFLLAAVGVYGAESPQPADPGKSPGDSKVTGVDTQSTAAKTSGTLAAQPVPAPATSSAKPNPISLNEMVLSVVESMPSGGKYSTSSAAFAGLGRAIQASPEGQLNLKPDLAKPAFCSGATYLVFLSVLDRLNRDGKLALSGEVANALLMKEQVDGEGVWGRWNANGPGTGRLFHELKLGKNFTSFREAKRGDFMKIWWSQAIGSKESGHSVVFMGTTTGDSGETLVRYWSSNVPNGFGIRTVAKSKIKRILFSRLETPAGILGATKLPETDAYLSQMTKRSSTAAEMLRMVGLGD